MKGKEILNSCKNKVLGSGKLQSFVLHGELVEKINVTFLKFDKWVKIVSSDEITTVAYVNNDFDEVNFDGNDPFHYPIDSIDNLFPDFKKYKGKQLLKWKELVWKNNAAMSYGINLYFKDNLNLIIHNKTMPDNKIEYIFQNTIPEDLIEK